VYSSPIRRALDTAEAVAARLSLTAQLEEALLEYDFGEMLSGLTWKEIQERRPGLIEALVSNDREFPHYPGEEGREAFRQRVCRGLWTIAERHAKEEGVAVLTHAGPIAVFLLEVLDRGYQRPIPFTIDNASLTTVEIVEAGASLGGALPRAVLTGLNDTCHLAGE
jgi:probable phosphoglycerate mutase